MMHQALVDKRRRGEAAHGDLKFTAPFAGEFQWFAALVSVGAFITLWKYKLDILKVIGAYAVLGLTYT